MNMGNSESDVLKSLGRIAISPSREVVFVDVPGGHYTPSELRAIAAALTEAADKLEPKAEPAPELAPEPDAAEVMAEVERAMCKFPTWPTDPLHALAVLGEEFGELTKDVLQFTYEPHKTSRENVRKEAIQTAAMALRFAASLDVYRYLPCDQHKQTTAAVDARRKMENKP